MAARKKFLPLFLLIFQFLIIPVLAAQESDGDASQPGLASQEETEPVQETVEADEISAETAEELVVPDYFYELKEDGTPFFSQVISWQAIEGCLDYEFILQDMEENEIMRERTEETILTINLPPGNYRYTIIVYNLLNKAEVQSDWIEISVIKAEIPHIDDLKPAAIYVEEENYQVTISGDNLLPEAQYVLVNQKTGKVVMEISDKTQDGLTLVILHLPEKEIDFGNYLVKVTNPGGIFDISDSGFKVRYQKPVDLAFSLGYSPTIPLYNEWVTTNWPDGFYPVGFIARLDLYLLKRRWGYLGPEIVGQFHSMQGGIPEATINSLSLKAGLNVVYKYLFVKSFHAVLRAGAGVDFNSHSFDYEGIPGPEITSADLYFTAGAAFQIYLKKWLYVELGADWTHIIHRTYPEGRVAPFISAGLSY